MTNSFLSFVWPMSLFKLKKKVFDFWNVFLMLKASLRLKKSSCDLHNEIVKVINEMQNYSIVLD